MNKFLNCGAALDPGERCDCEDESCKHPDILNCTSCVRYEGCRSSAKVGWQFDPEKITTVECPYCKHPTPEKFAPNKPAVKYSCEECGKTWWMEKEKYTI